MSLEKPYEKEIDKAFEMLLKTLGGEIKKPSDEPPQDFIWGAPPSYYHYPKYYTTMSDHKLSVEVSEMPPAGGAGFGAV